MPENLPTLLLPQPDTFRNCKIFVGFSGGADSTVLLLLLSRLMAGYGTVPVAVHFNHQLRADSEKDAQWCENFCRERNIPLLTKKLNVVINGSGTKTSIENAARECRLEAWRGLAGTGDYIALGHHHEDRAENLLMRLCRGSNTTGLTSMRREQQIGELIFIRPMLLWTKQNIIEYLEKEGITDWCRDITNEDSDSCRRNFIRHRILPPIYREMPFAFAGIQRSIEVLEQDAEYIEQTAAAAFESMHDRHNRLDANAINQIHPAIRIRVLRRWLKQITGADHAPERNLLARLEKIGAKGKKVIVPLRGGWELDAEGGWISLRQNITPPQPCPWKWREQPELEFGEYILTAMPGATETTPAPEQVNVRTWQPGDRIVPKGKNSPVKLKKLFTDAGIRDKHRIPIICSPEGIIIQAGERFRSEKAVFRCRRKK